MKKILALLLALVLVLSFSLVSCDELLSDDLFGDDLLDGEDDDGNKKENSKLENNKNNKDDDDDDDDDDEDDYYIDGDYAVNTGEVNGTIISGSNGGTIISGSNGTIISGSNGGTIISGSNGGTIISGSNGTIGTEIGGIVIGTGDDGSISITVPSVTDKNENILDDFFDDTEIGDVIETEKDDFDANESTQNNNGGSDIGGNTEIATEDNNNNNNSSNNNNSNDDYYDETESEDIPVDSEERETEKEFEGKAPTYDTLEETYNAAIDNIAQADNITVTSLQEISVSVYGFTQKLLENYVIKKYDGNNFSLKKTSGIGQEVTTSEVRYVDGTIYKSSSDSAQDTTEQYEGTRTQAILATGDASFDEKFVGVPASWLLQGNLYTTGNKSYVEFALSGDQCMSLFSSISAYVSAEDITSASYTVYFGENGEIESMVALVSMKVDLGEIKNLPANFSYEVVYSNMGTTTV